jgi:hypothetical protein
MGASSDPTLARCSFETFLHSVSVYCYPMKLPRIEDLRARYLACDNEPRASETAKKWIDCRA